MAGLVSVLSLVVDDAVAVADVVSFVRLITGLTSFDVAGAELAEAKQIKIKMLNFFKS